MAERAQPVEGNLASIECLGADHTCCQSPAGVLHSSTADGLRGFLELLSPDTPADRIAPREQPPSAA